METKGCGGWTRTTDIRGMNPTRYQLRYTARMQKARTGRAMNAVRTYYVPDNSKNVSHLSHHQ